VALTSDGVIAHPQSKYGNRFSIIRTTLAHAAWAGSVD
jgi:hypothetical protein